MSDCKKEKAEIKKLKAEIKKLKPKKIKLLPKKKQTPKKKEEPKKELTREERRAKIEKDDKEEFMRGSETLKSREKQQKVDKEIMKIRAKQQKIKDRYFEDEGGILGNDATPELRKLSRQEDKLNENRPKREYVNQPFFDKGDNVIYSDGGFSVVGVITSLGDKRINVKLGTHNQYGREEDGRKKSARVEYGRAYLQLRGTDIKPRFEKK